MQILEPIWLCKNNGYSDVVFLSSINIMRNVARQKFPSTSTTDENHFISDILCSSIETNNSPIFSYDKKYKLAHLEESELRFFYERYLLPKKITNNEYAYLYTSENERKSILINEREHISIRVSDTTRDIFSLYNMAENIERIFECSVVFAFDDDFGYLTKSIKNAGCAIVASSVLCIPTLAYFNKEYLSHFYKECNALGFVVLNEKGQKANSNDNFICIKNKYSFGISENDILNTLIYIIDNLIEKEIMLREKNIHTHKSLIEDKIFRSYNLLKSARLISYREAKNALLWLRLAVFYNILEININTINKMLLFLKKGHLEVLNNHKFENYNELRAYYISTLLE